MKISKIQEYIYMLQQACLTVLTILIFAKHYPGTLFLTSITKRYLIILQILNYLKYQRHSRI